jgi:hypothetical protein
MRQSDGLNYNEGYAHRGLFTGQAQVHWDALCASLNQARRDRDAAIRERDEARAALERAT